MTVTSANEYDIGNTLRATAAFKVDGVLTDPSTVTFKVRSPDGDIDTYVYGDGSGVVVKDAVGEYHADLTLVEAGVWAYRWKGTGDAAAAEEVEFRVRKSIFGATP